MSSHAPHSHSPLTAIGFSIGFVGIVGLVISLIALIPLNAYNIALAVHTAAQLQKAYGRRGSILIPGPYQPVQVFLFGTIAFSVITIMLLLATCWRNASARNRPQRSRRGRGKRVGRERRGSKASSIAESIHSVQSERSSSSQSTFLQNPSSSWISQFSTMSFILQFCWAIFGKVSSPHCYTIDGFCAAMQNLMLFK